MKFFLLLIFFLGLSNISCAEKELSWRVSIGGGLAFKKNLRAGNTYENLDKKYVFKPIPIIAGSYGIFSLGPQGIMIKAWGEQGKSVSAFIKRDGDRYHGLNMIDRKDSVFTGVAVRFYKYGLNFSHDISGRSKGSIAQLSYGEFYILSQSLLLRAGATLEWMDDRYAEYYYGVRKTEATTSRNEYHLNNYFQPGLNILPIYKFSAKSSLMGGLNLKLVPKYIRNSPTMNGNTFDYGGLIGYTYEL